MNPEDQQRIQMSVATTEITPVYADDVLIGQTIKQNKLPDGTLEKEGLITFFFIDMITQKPVAKIVTSRITAQQFNHLLGDTLQKMNTELRSNKETVYNVHIEPEKHTGYIG